jgi:hypothetical protein
MGVRRWRSVWSFHHTDFFRFLVLSSPRAPASSVRSASRRHAAAAIGSMIRMIRASGGFPATRAGRVENSTRQPGARPVTPFGKLDATLLLFSPCPRAGCAEVVESFAVGQIDAWTAPVVRVAWASLIGEAANSIRASQHFIDLAVGLGIVDRMHFTAPDRTIERQLCKLLLRSSGYSFIVATRKCYVETKKFPANKIWIGVFSLVVLGRSRPKLRARDRREPERNRLDRAQSHVGLPRSHRVGCC